MKSTFTKLALSIAFILGIGNLQAQNCWETNCGADAGVTIPPANTTVNAAPYKTNPTGGYSIQPSYPNANSTYSYIITQLTDTSANQIGQYADVIVGVAGSDGVYDLTGKPGNYKLTGFIYAQTELNQISGNTLVKTLLGTSGTETLGELFAKISTNTTLGLKYLTIEEVLNILTGPIKSLGNAYLCQVIGFQPCLDVENQSFNTTVGITNPTINNSVGLYPNPASTTLVVDLNDLKATNLSILNAVGQVVYNQRNATGKVMVNTESLLNGNYMVLITTNEGVGMKKLQIAR